MKNRRNIVEQKYPPENPNDIWLKDGKFYRSTSEGWVVVDSETEYTSKESMIADNPKGGTIGIDKETGEASIYNDVAKQWSPLGGGMKETTWQELKDKRDAGELNPGSLYRITDYNCTTTQEDTRSAGNQFDIVLLALSEDKLSEEGWAMMHENIYDVTFDDGVTLKCWLYEYYAESVQGYVYNIVNYETLRGVGEIEDGITINEETKTAIIDDISSTELIDINLAYNYFQNSKLEAWKVWYSLDNDTSRFAWADDGETPTIVIEGTEFPRSPQYDNLTDVEGLYAWGTDPDNIGIWFTNTENPNVGYGVLDSEGLESGDVISTIKGLGRGVIYRLIDEFNNDIKYDFKNIQFKRTITDGQYDANGTETWCYTLNLWYNDICQDASIVGNTLPNDEGFINGVYGNIFGYATACDLYIEEVNTFAFALGNNVILSFEVNLDDEYFYYGIYSNTIGNSFYSNTIGNRLVGNTIGNEFNSNTIGDNFNGNMIENSFYRNTIGNGVYFNTIGNNFSRKTISDNTGYKNYGNHGVELATKDDLN